MRKGNNFPGKLSFSGKTFSLFSFLLHLFNSLVVELTGPCGTPAWMAPEMLDGTVKITTATDVYGLGLIMWEMKSAERPYANLNLSEVCQAINSGVHLQIPHDLPQEVKILIRGCWHKEAKQRPTCDEILGKLNQMSFPDHWKALFGASPLMDTPSNGISFFNVVIT